MNLQLPQNFFKFNFFKKPKEHTMLYTTQKEGTHLFNHSKKIKKLIYILTINTAFW